MSAPLSMRDQFALSIELEDQLVDAVLNLGFGRMACFARLPQAPHEMEDLKIPEQDDLTVRVHCQALARLRYMMADAMIMEKMYPSRPRVEADAMLAERNKGDE